MSAPTKAAADASSGAIHPNNGEDDPPTAVADDGVVAAAMAVVDGVTGEGGEFVAAEGSIPAAAAPAGVAGVSLAVAAGQDGKPPPAKKRRVSKKSSKNRNWNDMLYELLRFKSIHGHCRVPGSKGALGSWVVQQRQQYHALKAKHAQEANSKLMGVGAHRPEDDKPMARAQHPEASAHQTERRRHPQALDEERIAVLNTIDFVWDVVQFDHDVRWNQRYQELVEYVRVNGHAVVPQSCPLGQWVKMQRENKKESDLKAAGMRPKRAKPRPCLTRERQEKLDAIGFVWKVAKPPVGWERRFQQLVEYQRLHGDCNVPQSYPPDKSFGRWIMKQRCEYSLKLRGQKSQLTDEREARLNAIGFSWVAPNFKRKTIPEPHLGDDVIGRDEGIALLAGTTTVHHM